MVSLRCKLMVKEELEELGLHHAVLDLGMVEVLEDISAVQHDQLKASLLKSGLGQTLPRRPSVIYATTWVKDVTTRLKILAIFTSRHMEFIPSKRNRK